MELKRIYIEDGIRHFEFVEEDDKQIIQIRGEDPDFGYLALVPRVLFRDTPEKVDESLPGTDEVLTFIGRERVLTASLAIIHYLARVAEVPIHISLEERFRQRILTIFSSAHFFDLDTLERYVFNIIREVDRQLPILQEIEDEEGPDFDPLDHIGEEGVNTIYEEEGTNVLVMDSLGGDPS